MVMHNEDPAQDVKIKAMSFIYRQKKRKMFKNKRDKENRRMLRCWASQHFAMSTNT